jgi:hypothetical protein
MLDPELSEYEAGGANHSTATLRDVARFKSESITLHYRRVRRISYYTCRMQIQAFSCLQA